MRILPVLSLALLIVLALSMTGCKPALSDDEVIRVLILSGKNNHQWKQTEAVLLNICQAQESLHAEICTRPDTLSLETLQQYDVLLNNWNSWPENEVRWSESTEDGLLEFIRRGGGLITFHASSSTFYQWDEFREISTASWEENTHHGKMSPVKVEFHIHDHPLTRGLSDFYIYDELWIDARSNEKFTTLAYAVNEELTDTSGEKQAALMVAEYGNGRILHTILGHNARAMRNTGFETLLIRGIEWAARGQVSSAIPQEMRISPQHDQLSYSWLENDSVLALYNHEDLIWQYNFRNRYGKPYFHPVYLGKTRFTSLSPDDHRWHLGQWFCWKFINGINYWEYVGDSYNSQGTTKITDISISKDSDFSARIELEILYHPPGAMPVMKENRSIVISPPIGESLAMDYKLKFEALSDTLILDRTPILGEADGKSWGGYAGLSLRFNQDFLDARWIAPGGAQSVNGSDGEWLFMGFTGLHGEEIGSAIFISDQSRRKGEGWYLINDPAQPFYYFSPAFLYLSPLTLMKGDELELKYQVRHLSGLPTTESLEKQYQEYISH